MKPVDDEAPGETRIRRIEESTDRAWCVMAELKEDESDVSPRKADTTRVDRLGFLCFRKSTELCTSSHARCKGRTLVAVAYRNGKKHLPHSGHVANRNSRHHPQSSLSESALHNTSSLQNLLRTLQTTTVPQRHGPSNQASGVLYPMSRRVSSQHSTRARVGPRLVRSKCRACFLLVFEGCTPTDDPSYNSVVGHPNRG